MLINTCNPEVSPNNSGLWALFDIKIDDNSDEEDDDTSPDDDEEYDDIEDREEEEFPTDIG